MSEAEFLSQGGQRIGQKPHTAISSNRADCGFAIPDYVQRVIGLAGLVEPGTPVNLPAWKQCGPIAMVDNSLTGDNIYGYRIQYGDATLAERAFDAFRVYGSEQPRDR